MGKRFVRCDANEHYRLFSSLRLDSESGSNDHSQQSRLLSKSLRTTGRFLTQGERYGIRSFADESDLVETHDHA